MERIVFFIFISLGFGTYWLLRAISYWVKQKNNVVAEYITIVDENNFVKIGVCVLKMQNFEL